MKIIKTVCRSFRHHYRKLVIPEGVKKESTWKEKNNVWGVQLKEKEKTYAEEIKSDNYKYKQCRRSKDVVLKDGSRVLNIWQQNSH